MAGILETLRTEGAVIWHAPWSFAICVAVVSGAIFLVIRALKAQEIANLNSQLALKVAESADYKRQLDGATPEEARRRIERLEGEVQALKPMQRSLSPQQRDAIVNSLKNSAQKTQPISVIYSKFSMESAHYARNFAEAFNLAGWNVKPDVIFFGERLDTGLNLVVQSLNGRSALAVEIAAALEEAGVSFTWQEDAGLPAPFRLCVDVLGN